MTTNSQGSARLAPPGALLADVHAQQPWTRLHRDGVPVGFARTAGGVRLYSVDGYGWSGSVITADLECQQVPFRFGRDRIFHGDLVRLPERSGAQTLVDRVVGVTSGGSVVLMDPETEWARELTDLWPPPSTARVRERFGSLMHDHGVRSRLERVTRRAVGGGRSRRARTLALTGAIAGAVAGAGALQMLALGHIGPVTSLLAGLGGALGFWYWTRRSALVPLRRKEMLGMAVESGILLGAALMALAALGVGQPEVARSARQTIGLMAAHGVLGFLLALICATLGADLVAWRTGGYDDPPEEAFGFRHSG